MNKTQGRSGPYARGFLLMEEIEETPPQSVTRTVLANWLHQLNGIVCCLPLKGGATEEVEFEFDRVKLAFLKEREKVRRLRRDIRDLKASLKRHKP